MKRLKRAVSNVVELGAYRANREAQLDEAPVREEAAGPKVFYPMAPCWIWVWTWPT